MNKRNKILVGCLALLLALSVGYALFSETIEINGTATAKGNFDITLECISTETNNDDLVKSCIVDGNKVTIVNELSKPRDYVLYNIRIKNTGSIPAKLKQINSPNNDIVLSNAGECYYTISEYSLQAYYYITDGGNDTMCDSDFDSWNPYLAPNSTIDIQVTTEWLSVGSNETQPELPVEGYKIEYPLELLFEQATN